MSRVEQYCQHETNKVKNAMKIYIRSEELLDEIEETVREAVGATGDLEDARDEAMSLVSQSMEAGERVEELLSDAVVLTEEEVPEGAVILDTDDYGDWHNDDDVYGDATQCIQYIVDDLEDIKEVPPTAEEAAEHADREAALKARRIAVIKAELEALEA